MSSPPSAMASTVKSFDPAEDPPKIRTRSHLSIILVFIHPSGVNDFHCSYLLEARYNISDLLLEIVNIY